MLCCWQHQPGAYCTPIRPAAPLQTKITVHPPITTTNTHATTPCTQNRYMRKKRGKDVDPPTPDIKKKMSKKTWDGIVSMCGFVFWWLVLVAAACANMCCMQECAVLWAARCSCGAGCYKCTLQPLPLILQPTLGSRHCAPPPHTQLHCSLYPPSPHLTATPARS